MRTFVDFERMTCDFASPVSVSFLAYMAGRPKTNEELARISPIDGIFQVHSDEWIRMYRDGDIALYNFWFHDVGDYFSMYQIFFTNDVTMIGYPTQRPEEKYSGLIANISSGTITIMNDSKHQDACWVFTKYLIRHFTPATVLRDAFENRVSALDGTLFCYYDDGTKSFGVDRWEDKPGFRMVFHREDADRLRDIFEKGGEPWIIGYDESLGEIVEEELSALCAGHISPEECGNRLQSRVSIWLNERK